MERADGGLMPAAKADYSRIVSELAETWTRAGTTAVPRRVLYNELRAGFPGAVKGRVWEWFKANRVPGWTVYAGRVVKRDSVAAMTPEDPVPAPEPTMPVQEKPAPIVARKPEFGPDVMKFVPAAEPAINYYPRRLGDGQTDIMVLERAWQERRHIMLYGKPGSGKSTAPWVVAQKLGLPVVRLSMDEAKDPSKILGQWVPNEGGGFRFVRGPALTLYEQGGLLVIEEVNAITPGCAFTLHPMLDDIPCMLVDDLGIVAQKHPDFWCVGTMNPSDDAGATGTQQVNYALWDRFKSKLYYDYDRDIEAKLVKNDKRVLQIRDKLRGSDIRTEVTTRMLRDFFQNISIFGWHIAKTMFVANFNAEEREMVAETCKLIGG